MFTFSEVKFAKTDLCNLTYSNLTLLLLNFSQLNLNKSNFGQK